MWLIIALIIVGVVLLVAELILLPGLTLAGIGGLICYTGAAWLGFTNYGRTGGIIVIAVIAVISVIAVAFSLRAKTWRRLSLDHQIDSTSQPRPEETLQPGMRGVTVTRLAPLGKIEINSESYEARALGDIYIDPRVDVEVVGFENFTVIVRLSEQQIN